MAYFKGTIEEYHRFLGPRIRNAVQQMTRKERLARNGICEHCHEKKELQSAHRDGCERREIVGKVLNEFPDIEENGIEIEVVESRILSDHEPVSEKFLFLCDECHKKYDNKDRREKRFSEGKALHDEEKQDDIAIGQYVQTRIRGLADEGRISEKTAMTLVDKAYCRSKFGLGFPLLVPIDNEDDCRSKAFISGSRRYYKEPVIIGDRKYMVCNDWREKHKKKFDEWYDSL